MLPNWLLIIYNTLKKNELILVRPEITYQKPVAFLEKLCSATFIFCTTPLTCGECKLCKRLLVNAVTVPFTITISCSLLSNSSGSGFTSRDFAFCK